MVNRKLPLVADGEGHALFVGSETVTDFSPAGMMDSPTFAALVFFDDLDDRAHLPIDHAIAWHERQLRESHGSRGDQGILDAMRRAKSCFDQGLPVPRNSENAELRLVLGRPISDSLQALVALLGKLGRFEGDVFGRDLVCTPFDGNYGLAGWVVCLNGSPPRGVLVILKDNMVLPEFAFADGHGRARKVVAQSYQAIIERFKREHLEDRTEAFVLSTKKRRRVTSDAD